MNPSAYPAAQLLEVERKNLAILALAGPATISELASQRGVSRTREFQKILPSADNQDPRSSQHCGLGPVHAHRAAEIFRAHEGSLNSLVTS